MAASHLIGRQHLLLRLPAAASAADLQQRADNTLSSVALLAALDSVLAACGVSEDDWLTVARLEVDLGSCHPDALEQHLIEHLPTAMAAALARAQQAASPVAWAYAAVAQPGAPIEPGPHGSMTTQDAAESYFGAAATSQTATSQTATSQTATSQTATSQTATSQTATSQTDTSQTDTSQTDTSQTATSQTATSQTDTSQPATLVAWQAWLYFLRTGALPQPVGQMPVLADWEAVLLSVLPSLPAGRLADLRTVLGLAVACKRLIRQFSVSVVTAVIQQLTREADAVAIQVLNWVTSDVLYPREAGEELLEALLHRLAAGKAVPWVPMLQLFQAAPAASGRIAAANALRAALSVLNDPFPSDTRQATSPVVSAEGQPSIPGAIQQTPELAPELAPGLAPELVLKLALTSELAPQPASELAPEPAPGVVREDSPNELPAYTKAETPARAPSSFGETTAREVLTEYVTNAGLVLLHPFLPACFTTLGWLSAAGQFVNEEARAEAALLLHFLATGARQAAEYELRLPLFLCGTPADTPPRRHQLSQGSCSEGTALLEAALAHWSALKATSVDGLRTAFLQREGKLERDTPFGPALTVARQSQDVLLDRLPYGWGLGLVTLPWLAVPLTVHWP